MLNIKLKIADLLYRVKLVAYIHTNSHLIMTFIVGVKMLICKYFVK